MMSVKLSHHPDSNTSDIGDANRTFDALRQVWKAYCAEKVTTFHPLAATCMLAACMRRPRRSDLHCQHLHHEAVSVSFPMNALA